MSKFNPNTAAFVPTSKTVFPQQQSQAKQQKANPNTSAHAGPPAANVAKSRSSSSGSSTGGAGAKKTGYKQREPKSRNNHNNNSTNLPVFEDDFDLHLEDEVLAGNFKSRGRRGQISINHLLDFSLPSRELENPLNSHHHHHHSTTRPRRRRRSSNIDKIHLVGEEFVNANYRFIVDYRPDYNGQIMDPNLVLDNFKILRVVVPRGHHCPICLTEDIVAPRMISCGHIFCFTCLLSFLDSENIKKKDQPFRKFKECPLCSLSVRPDETKPVMIIQTDERFEIPRVGQDVVFKLMARPMDNILPIPHSLNLNHSKIGNIPWYSDTELFSYSRIMKGGLKFLVSSFEDDKREILKQYEEDKSLYNDDGKYVKRAIEEIDIQINVMKESFGNNYNEPNPLVSGMENLSITKDNSGLNDSNCYFYYQTSFNTTTRYFLSPLDVKVLLGTYGSYSNFPTTLLLKVDNVSYGHMVTETTLKRHKYMSHLPLGTEFAFIEVNWKNLLPPEVYKLFAKELSERRRKLLSKLKREDRDKQNYETQQELKTMEFYMQENDGWGSYEFLNQSSDRLPSLHPLGEEELVNNNDDDNNNNNNEVKIEDDDETRQYETTVWGTKILKTKIEDDEARNSYDEEADELIRRAKENSVSSGNGRKRGRKKKLIVISSGNGRSY